MNFKQLLADDDAVSPVIGVILMVAITVILAAVIGTFVLGLGDQVQQTAPNAQISGDQGTADIEGTSETVMQVSHGGGDGLNEDNVNVTVDGTDAYVASGGTSDSYASADSVEVMWASGNDISAGSSAEIIGYDSGSPSDVTSLANKGLSSGETVRVVWQADDGDRSSTLFERDVN